MSKLKVKVKNLPVFYNSKRHLKGNELVIEEDHHNEQLFEKLEVVEDDPFKGVKATTLKKVLEDAEVEFSEEAERDELIKLVKDNDLSLEK